MWIATEKILCGFEGEMAGVIQEKLWSGKENLRALKDEYDLVTDKD